MAASGQISGSGTKIVKRDSAWHLCAEQNPFSQEVEVGAAEHLAFEGFDAADVAFDRAAAHP
jgi:hypothetical protein